MHFKKCISHIIKNLLQIVSEKKVVKITAFVKILDKHFGKRGTPKREKYEKEYEDFKQRVLGKK